MKFNVMKNGGRIRRTTWIKMEKLNKTTTE